MDVRLVNAFVGAFMQIMPQLGFSKVSRGSMGVKDQYVIGQGVTVLIGMTGKVRGSVAYNMRVSTAMKIASVMMMGTSVTELSEFAQSAISEMVNMLTANAAILFEKEGLEVDISPPNLIIGDNFKAKVCNNKYIVLDMVIDGEKIELDIGLDVG